ncbi:MAG: rod shape-determining protein MreD [Gammaproteobacteria bacterium]|nr:rod shape-determining protein MreD [Gammaproteobacteria bacterium]
MIGLGQQRKDRCRVVIATSFLLALILDVVPLPHWAEPFRPEWVSLVLIYWCMAMPQTVNVGYGWLMGLIVDLMQGSLLGQNALAKSVIAFLAVAFHLRVRMFPLWQQSIFVAILVLIGQAITIWVKGLTGGLYPTWVQWMPGLSSMVLWPWLFVVLRDVRRLSRAK